VTALADIGLLQAVRAGPDDLFVLTLARSVSTAEHQNIKAALQAATEHWGFTPRVAILDAGMTLAVIAPAADKAMPAVEELVAACEQRFAGPSMVDEPDDEDISHPPSGITFGMIRRARAEIGGQP
jgi:hypothetical protein